MIEAWHVREALRSRFGSALVDRPGIWDRAASLLQRYAPYRDTFESLAAQLEDVIFNTAADDVMGILFDNLKVYSVNYEALHEYCMATGSFAALRVLYTRYAAFMSAEERKIVARVIRDSRPRVQWEEWLDPEDRI